uniref:Uncharacterized protein n=1 Tax=Arundo donax TaxID=35708 RepID=A0A0A8ZBL1_ARUDO
MYLSPPVVLLACMQVAISLSLSLSVGVCVFQLCIFSVSFFVSFSLPLCISPCIYIFSSVTLNSVSLSRYIF